MASRFLTSLPVFKEVSHVDDVLDQVARFAPDILVVDDGSTDGTADRLANRDGLHIVTHSQNIGYGAALRSAFQFACDGNYDVVITIDCDGQHEPQRIPEFAAACRQPGVDIVSGSRYLQSFSAADAPPADRREINIRLTEQINRRLGLNITDAFCGFKAYRTSQLSQLKTVDSGYAMPLELWVRAAAAGLNMIELPVPLIYLEEQRSFGGELDDSQTRLLHYHDVLERSLELVAKDRCDSAAP
ncbi:MAG: glycosyltransferase family 2 protein, partial [Planctomycetales bacterium]